MQSFQRRRDPVKKALWLTVGVLATMVVVLALALLEKPPPLSRPPESPQSRLEVPAPSEQPHTLSNTAPIIVAGQGGQDCEEEEPVFDVTVMAVGERAMSGSSQSSQQPVYLQDQESVVRKYYLDNDSVPAAERSRLADIFIVGRHLKVRFVVCGSGGFRYLTFVQPIATG